MDDDTKQQQLVTATAAAYGQDVPPRADIDEILRRKRKAREYKVCTASCVHQPSVIRRATPPRHFRAQRHASATHRSRAGDTAREQLPVREFVADGRKLRPMRVWTTLASVD